MPATLLDRITESQAVTHKVASRLLRAWLPEHPSPPAPTCLPEDPLSNLLSPDDYKARTLTTLF